MADINDLNSALVNADAAGDTAGAKALADHIRSLNAPAVANTAAPISATDSFLKGIRDPFDGAAQLLSSVLPSGVTNTINSANNWIASKVPSLVAKLPEATQDPTQKTGIDGLIQQQEQNYQAGRAAAGNDGMDWGRVAGNIASPVNLLAASKLPAVTGTASTLAKILAGGASGGASAMLNPVTDGDYWAEKAKQGALGTIAGGIIPSVASGLSKIISPAASTNPSLQLIKSGGVNPTLGQTLGGWANSAEEKAQSIPIIGNVIANARANTRSQFNESTINRATAPIGESVSGTGSPAIKEAGDLISSAYTKAKDALGGFAIDPQAQTELSGIRQMANALPKPEKATLNAYFNNYLNVSGLTSDSFKVLDSKLTTDIGRFSGSQDAYQQQVGAALKEVQSIIINNAKRANPAAGQMFDNADSAYANLVRIEGAAVGAKSTEGVFTPGQLLTSIRASDNSVRDRATARGTALMQDWANAGQNVLGNKVQDTGTAGRLGYGVLGAAMYSQPIPTATAMATALTAYTPAMQKLLNTAVSSRPDSAQGIANALNKYSPALIPGGAQVGIGLANQ